MNKSILCGALVVGVTVSSVYAQMSEHDGVALKDKLDAIERLMSLRNSPRRQEALAARVADAHALLAEMKNELAMVMAECERKGIAIECREDFELLERELEGIDRMLQGRGRSSGAIFIMQLGPKLIYAVQLLGVVNSALSSKIDLIKNDIDERGNLLWTKKLLKISAMVTAAVIAIIYIGNSYAWWAVPIDTTFVDGATFFLRAFFGA